MFVRRLKATAKAKKAAEEAKTKAQEGKVFAKMVPKSFAITGAVIGYRHALQALLQSCGWKYDHKICGST